MKFENQNNYNCEIHLDDGSIYKIYANELHNNNLDKWKSWSCAAGHLRIFINENFDVYGGECKNDYLGNLTEDWSPLDKFTICKKENCNGCTDDLTVEKYKGR